MSANHDRPQRSIIPYQVRIPRDLYAVARIAAAAEGRSVNAWMVQAIRSAVLRQAQRQKDGPVAAALDAASPTKRPLDRTELP